MTSSEQSVPGVDGLLVVGSINLDRSLVVDRFPRPGETLSASALTSSIGGKGANQAVAAACAGARVQMTAMVGADDEGEAARRALRGAGVDTTGVHRTSDAPTGTAWITVASGDNTIIVVPGANHEWTQPLSGLPPTKVVLCQLEIPVTVVQATAAATDGVFVLNAAPAQPLEDDLLRQCDVLIVNEHELAEVSGAERLDTEDVRSLISAARTVTARGVGTVVTTLGARGALLCTAQTVLQAGAPPRTPVVDTTGAGDAFCGVFAARLVTGDSVADALRYAVTAGSWAVRHATAQGGYDDFTDLRRFIDESPCVTTISDDQVM